MARADLVNLPMHSGRALVVNLHPVDADIAGAGLGISRVHICQRDETPAIFRPAFQNRQIGQGKLVVQFFDPSDARLPGMVLPARISGARAGDEFLA